MSLPHSNSPSLGRPPEIDMTYFMFKSQIVYSGGSKMECVLISDGDGVRFVIPIIRIQNILNGS